MRVWWLLSGGGADPEWFVFSSRRRHTGSKRDWSSDVCSSDLSTSPEPWKPTFTFGGNVNVGFQGSGLVDGGQHRRNRHAVAYVHGDIADGPVHRRGDAIVVKLHFLLLHLFV